jgi:hypothetical protein
LHAFGATIAARWLDIGRLVQLYFYNSTRVTDQAGVAGIAVLAQVPNDDRKDHGAGIMTGAMEDLPILGVIQRHNANPILTDVCENGMLVPGVFLAGLPVSV